MRVLLVMDPLSKLNPKYDSTLALIQELLRRGHRTWISEVQDVFASEKKVFARTRPAETGPPREVQDLRRFDLILIRKEPPFDLSYLYLTYLLERVRNAVAISNDPVGIRNHNEKLACFLFPKGSPQSLVSCRVKDILDFQHTIQKDLVIKPLNDRAGYGIFQLKLRRKNNLRLLRKATLGEMQPVLAQEFLGRPPVYRDKRITLLDGKILFVYEKEARGKDFRTNLSQGGVALQAAPSAKEKRRVASIRLYLRKHGLHLVGLDFLEGKLIDFNVTCPGGFCDAKALSPRLGLVEAWADFLESLVRA